MKTPIFALCVVVALFFASALTGRAGTEMAPAAPPPANDAQGYWVPAPAPPPQAGYYYPPAPYYAGPPPPYYYGPGPGYYGPAYYGYAPGVRIYGPGLFFGFGFHGRR